MDGAGRDDGQAGAAARGAVRARLAGPGCRWPPRCARHRQCELRRGRQADQSDRRLGPRCKVAQERRVRFRRGEAQSRQGGDGDRAARVRPEGRRRGACGDLLRRSRDRARRTELPHPHGRETAARSRRRHRSDTARYLAQLRRGREAARGRARCLPQQFVRQSTAAFGEDAFHRPWSRRGRARRGNSDCLCGEGGRHCGGRRRSQQSFRNGARAPLVRFPAACRCCHRAARDPGHRYPRCSAADYRSARSGSRTPDAGLP